MSKKKYLISLFTLIFFSACSSSLQSVNVKRDGVDALIVENSAKVTYIKEHGNIDRFCAYRESDSDKTISNGLSLGISQGLNQESIGEENGTGGLALGGRSPVVLITRELMYRVCELTINLNTDEKTTIELYKDTIRAIIEISKNTHEVGSGVGSSMPTTINNTKIGIDENDDNDDEDDDDDE